MRTHRIFILMVSFLIIFTLLLGKIAYYQIVSAEKITRAATAMRSKQTTLKEYSRGPILDRNYLPLTDNSHATGLYCLPGEIIRVYQKSAKESHEEIFTKIVDKLAQHININKRVIVANLMAASQKGEPLVRVADNLSKADIKKLNQSNLSGVVTAPVIKRYDGTCSHILGYVEGKGTNEGVTGIEKQYNEYLTSSQKSLELVSVEDAHGRPIQGLMFKIRENSKDNEGAVVLTIDKRIQQLVEEAMARRINKGVVVVMDIATKEILAVASRPSFNPYDLPRALENYTDSPLTNRAFNSYYPGSLFKIVVAAAAIEEEILTREDGFHCEGSYEFSQQLAISCWKKEGHGSLNFMEAFANSCNPSFIEIGIKLGRSKLKEYADKLHLTDETIIGWMGNDNMKSYVNINPGLAGIGNACLGQQGVMLTPVQTTNLIATIADNGRWGTPSITKYAVDQEGVKHFPSPAKFEQVISMATAQKLQMLMEEVVANGTGKTASLMEVRVAGKTATSQTGSLTDDEEEILNTWFGGYLPADNPKWAIVVMVEEGTSGATSAAPVFRDVATGILGLFTAVN